MHKPQAQWSFTIFFFFLVENFLQLWHKYTKPRSKNRTETPVSSYHYKLLRQLRSQYLLPLIIFAWFYTSPYYSFFVWIPSLNIIFVKFIPIVYCGKPIILITFHCMNIWPFYLSIFRLTFWLFPHSSVRSSVAMNTFVHDFWCTYVYISVGIY